MSTINIAFPVRTTDANTSSHDHSHVVAVPVVDQEVVLRVESEISVEIEEEVESEAEAREEEHPDEEDEEGAEMSDEVRELRVRLSVAKTAHDFNYVWERGRELGLEQNGRVTIPALHDGVVERSAGEPAQPDGPKDFMGREVRVTKDATIEMREEDDSTPKLRGYAAMFNRETVIGWWFKFRESIAPGAFTKTVQEADVRHLFNHDPNWVLGRNKSGTLRLIEDNIGLQYDVDLNMKDPQAVTVRETVARGDVNQSSFAFIIMRELWEEPDDPDGGELPKRTILEAKLFDTSTVTYPAYEDTTALIAGSARGAALRSLGLEDEIIQVIANERFTPDAAQALRSVAQHAAELADRCEDGEPCPRAAEEAPAVGTADEPADEESPGGEEGTDRESNQLIEEMVAERDRISRLLARTDLDSETRQALTKKEKDLANRIADILINKGGESI